MADSIENICDLPPELLEEIFSKLEDVTDFQSVINTCPLWHDIMEYRKTARLFGKVLPILMKVKDQKTLHYPIKNMLLFRQVCKEWKLETDRQLALHHHFKRTETIQRFLTHASTLPEGINPILGNSVTFEIDAQRDFEPCLELIRRHGTYIKTIFLSFLIRNFPLNELQSALKFMPNLEWLIVKVHVENWIVGDQAPVLPPLPLLTKVSLLTEDSYPQAGPNNNQLERFINSFVIEYGAQLQSLTCSPVLLRIESISNLLPNLTSLEIKESPYISVTEDDLHTLSQADWALEFLTILCHGAPTIECSTGLMTMLNSFSKTLVSLDLSFKLERSINPSELNVFPCLKNVTLRIPVSPLPEEMKDRVNSLSVRCPNLKILRIATLYYPWTYYTIVEYKL
ncbi:unnamed protein product [Orchesella dallaii]|uniref:F-box domain-containing protein n=1 Tax=Orchesella dallaii TaxID=48710 RepID=A0ABP1RY37_9HEXA